MAASGDHGHSGSGSHVGECRSHGGRSTRLKAVAASVAVLACASIAACAGAFVSAGHTRVASRTDALLVLPGFGYNGAGEKAFHALADSVAAEGIDLFVPTYISRGGLAQSRVNLGQFIRDHRLDRYDRLHVFAFIAGAWTFNPMIEKARLTNLATVVYDRSPYQERAPRVADEELHFLTWLRYGSPVFDVARTPYPPLSQPDVKVAIVVETMPTAFVKGHEATVRSFGPIDFECDAFMQRHDDCMYVPLSHDDMYVRFATMWPELLGFIREGHFSRAANRVPPSGDPLAERRR
jgi:hypothetical protein